MSRGTAALLVLFGFLSSAHFQSQGLTIGIIDFYGLRRISLDAVQHMLTFKEGDAILLKDGPPAYLAESERRISALPGVERVRTSIVCCDSGNIIVFVGIEESGSSPTAFRSPSSGTSRLPLDVVEAGAAFETALLAAVHRGDVAEDDAHGHALSHDPASRAIEERFVDYAERYLPLLRQVLRDSQDAGHRALAAQVLGYVQDKQGVVADLVEAMNDPDERVRNNAMRALLVFTKMTAQPPPRVPYQPFVHWLNSVVWTDRNKASGALDELSQSRNSELLTTLRHEAFESLIEMARWKSRGHAHAALLILGRLAGLPEMEISQAWDRDNRESVISAAIERR